METQPVVLRSGLTASWLRLQRSLLGWVDDFHSLHECQMGGRWVQQQHRQQGQEAIGAEGPGEGQQPEGIGEPGGNQRQGHRQHEHHQQPIGRGGGERRQPNR